MFLTVLPYFQNTVTVLAGSQPPGLKDVITAWHKTPCPQTRKMDKSAPCKRLGTLRGSSQNHCSAACATELVPLSVLQGLGCSLVLIQQQGSLGTDSKLEKSLGGHVLPPPAQGWGNFKVRAALVKFWISPGKEVSQPPWIICSSA